MNVRWYDKREGPHINKDDPYIRFNEHENGRHMAYLNRRAMEAMGHPPRVLLGWDDDNLNILVIPVTNGDERALSVTNRKNHGQFSASGFLSKFRLEHLMNRRLPLVRSCDEYDPPAGSGLMVRLIEEEEG